MKPSHLLYIRIFPVLLAIFLGSFAHTFAFASQGRQEDITDHFEKVLPIAVMIFPEIKAEDLREKLIVLKADVSSSDVHERSLGTMIQRALQTYAGTPQGSLVLSEILNCELEKMNFYLGIEISGFADHPKNCKKSKTDKSPFYNSRRDSPREYYFVFFDSQNSVSPDIESWTDQNNRTVFILPGDPNQVISPDKLLNHLVHEVAITFDNTEDKRRDEIASLANGSCHVRTALSEPFMSLALRTLRAYTYEHEISNSAQNPYTSPLDSKSCLTGLRQVSNALSRYSEYISVSLDRIDSCKPSNNLEFGLFNDIDFAETFETGLNTLETSWSPEQLESYCKKWSQSPELSGQSIYFNTGPRPRLGGGGW